MTDNNPTELQPTHEIYGYLDKNNEPRELTDPEPVRVYDNELYAPTGGCVGVRRDAYEQVACERVCHDCSGGGKINFAKNRHYEDWKT